MRKYGDQNILDNWDDALTLASDYVRTSKFSDQFEPFARLRELLDRNIRPSVADVRKVLNCMLQDSFVRNMPELPRKVFDAGSGGRPVKHGTRIWDDGRIDTIEVRRPVILYPKARWKFPYGTSTMSYASAIHAVDTQVLPVHWIRDSSTASGSRVRLILQWVCETYGRDLKKTRPLQLKDAQEILRGGPPWKLCKRCELMKPDVFDPIYPLPE